MEWTPPRGTRDFYPDDMRIRQWLFEKFRQTSQVFGFEEYDAPIFESLELFIRKGGEEIVDQIYHFKDKSDRDLALRPEMTPSLVRMIVQKGNAIPKPIKWFAIPQCFRYERMSKGRRREHFQWNLDIIGEPSIRADAEVIGAVIHLLISLGLSKNDFSIHINNRKLLKDLLSHEGIREDKITDVFLVIDKLDKIPPETFGELLKEKGLHAEDIKTIFEVLKLRTFADIKKRIPQSQAVHELEELFKYLTHYGYNDYCTFSISVVRGLLYYTGTVFEVFDREKKFRAICGGGRYDNLFHDLGKIDLPAIGVGFGDVVITEVLNDKNLLPKLTKHIDYFMIPFSENEMEIAYTITAALRKQNNSVELPVSSMKMKKALALALELNARYAIIVAPEELKRNKVIIKNLSEHSEKEIDLRLLLS